MNLYRPVLISESLAANMGINFKSQEFKNCFRGESSVFRKD